jgi:tetratricopeptide (TPR) repeat protein
VLIVTFVTFALLNLLPGDVSLELLGSDATPSAIARVRSELRLDDPLVVRYMRWLGQALALLHPIADCDQAIAPQPWSSRAHAGRGQIYAAARDELGALGHFDRALDLDPTNVQARARKPVPGPQRLWTRDCGLFDMIEVDPQVAPFTNRGIAYDRKCDKAHALADYSEAIRLDPSQPESYINRGHILRDQRDYARAIADYSAAIRLDPRRAVAFAGRAAYQAQKDSVQAIAGYTEAIKLDPKNAAVLVSRGMTYLATKDYRQPRADFTNALHIDPMDSAALTGLGNILAQEGL